MLKLIVWIWFEYIMSLLSYFGLSLITIAVAGQRGEGGGALKIKYLLKQEKLRILLSKECLFKQIYIYNIIFF